MKRRSLLTAGLFSAMLDAQSAPLRRTTLDLAMSSSLFPSVNRNDARAAISVWTATLGRKRGYEVSPTVDIFDDPVSIRQRILSRSVGVLALDIFQYFRLSDIATLEPAFVTTRGSANKPLRYLLVTRSNSGLSTLASLRGKNLRVTTNTGANLGLAWLESQLAANSLPPAQFFFQSVESNTRASAAVLPVFFSKADAAIIDEVSFETIREMNPQLGLMVKPIATSPALAESILCFVTRAVEFRDVVQEAIRDIHIDPDGRQILLILRARQFVPTSRAALEVFRPLFRRMEALAT